MILRLGSFAIIYEEVEAPWVKEQMTWVYYSKIIGYFVSIIALAAFIFIIQFNR